jgi:heme exporter protein A
MSLSADSLACARDDRDLFSELSFDLHPGEALLVEGRNGSGKTTLLRILCGIRRPDQGVVRFRDEEIDRLGSDYHAHMAYVGHHDGIKRELTAEENLRWGSALGYSGDLSLTEALQRVHLNGFEDVYAHKFSAGQRRRLALARLLSGSAELWILDEPFTSLDRGGVQLVEELIAEHRDKGGMVVATSHHDMDLGDTGVRRLDLSARAD